MEDTKYYIWVATTIIVFSVFAAAGSWVLAILTLVISYALWSVKL